MLQGIRCGPFARETLQEVGRCEGGLALSPNGMKTIRRNGWFGGELRSRALRAVAHQGETGAPTLQAALIGRGGNGMEHGMDFGLTLQWQRCTISSVL